MTGIRKLASSAVICLSVYYNYLVAMAKSLRSKRKQKVKAVRREKYRKIEGKKCWEKHLALQAEKNENMLTEASEGVHLLHSRLVCYVLLY